MIRDLLVQTPAPSMSSLDVCIVGAGAAGITLAVELRRLGHSVLLLEGGGLQIEDAAQDPYRSHVVGLPHKGIHEGRFRAHGGTTNKWGGQILELDAIDFEKREWVAESGWPFPKQHLVPFYERALQLEGVDGSILDDAILWKALDLPIPDFPGLELYCSRWCPEPNFAALHSAVLQGTGVDVWLHANAVELMWENDRILSLRCRTQTGKDAVFRATYYVFALGAIESSRFFLQPPAGKNGLPWNSSGLLGRHFQDHIDCNVATVEPKHHKHFHAIFDDIYFKGRKYSPKLKINARFEEKHKLLNVAAYMHYPSETAEMLAVAKEMVREVLKGRVSSLRPNLMLDIVQHAPLILQKVYRRRMQHRAFRSRSDQGYLRVHCEQLPNSASSITLSGERDSLGLFRTRLYWNIAPEELHSIREYVKLAMKSLDKIAVFTPDPLLFRQDDSFIQRCEDTNHHMGGMRMHISPSAGVVDPDLRLHGMRNGFVCSSAVFPTSGFSNPTHTLLALTMRLADHLNRQRTRSE